MVNNWKNTEEYTPNWVDDTPWEESQYNPINIAAAKELRRKQDSKRIEEYRALGINPDTNQLIPSGTENDYLPNYDLEAYIIEEQKKLDIINKEVQLERQRTSNIAVKILNKEMLTDDDRLFLISKLKG